MFIAIGLGILSSIATEIITWLNKSLSGTVLQGDGAFIVATIVSFAIATITVVSVPGFHLSTNWQGLVGFFSVVFTSAQIWFVLVAKKLGLDVSHT